MGTRQTGGKTKLRIYEETTWATAPATPSVLFEIPYIKLDGGPKVNQVEFNEISGDRYPSAKLDGKKSIPITLTVGLHYDMIGHILKHAIGIPTSSIITTTYSHTFTLGSSNGEPEGLGIIRYNVEADNPYRRYRGLRVSTFNVKADIEGGVTFDVVSDGYYADPWSATDPAAGATINTYTSEPVGHCAGVIAIDGTNVGYVGAFDVTLDNKLGTDEYPVGNQCLRSDLARGMPTVDGNLEVFLMTDDALIAKAEAGTPITVAITYGTVGSDGDTGIKFTFDNCKLSIDSEPVDTSSGLSVKFAISASGPTAMKAELYNDVTSY